MESTRNLIRSYYKFRQHSRCYGFFGAIGSYISGSTLEETLGICQPGVMSTVLAGKHCNRCKTLHKTFGIAIKRLYPRKSCTVDVPEELQVARVAHYEELRLDLLHS